MMGRGGAWKADGQCSRARRQGPERLVAAPIARRLYAVGEGVGLPPESGSAHSLRAGGQHALSCLPCDVFDAVANAAQTSAQAPSDHQAYCVNGDADFYPFTGEPCKSGYQLGSGNCRRTDGIMVAVPREECLAQAGTVEVHFFLRQTFAPAPRASRAFPRASPLTPDRSRAHATSVSGQNR